MSVLGSFEYYKPHSLEEAINLFEDNYPDAHYLAGGTDLMVLMKGGRIRPKIVISLNYINGVAGINPEKDALHIGALTTHRQLELSSIIREQFPVLHDAVKQVGSVQIRNVATIGGNLCSALPSADTSSPLLVLGAIVKVIGSSGEREIPLEQFFIGPGQSALQGSEIATEVIIPYPSKRSGGAYVKLGRRNAMEIPLAGAAVLLELSDENTCVKAMVALTTSAKTPIRSSHAEDSLTGKFIDKEVLRYAGRQSLLDASPRSSFRTTAEYRKKVIPFLVERAGSKSIERVN